MKILTWFQDLTKTITTAKEITFPFLDLDAISLILKEHNHVLRMRKSLILEQGHSRSQRLRSFWSAPRIATSGHVQNWKSAIHGLPVTLRMLRAKCAKADWFWSQSIVFTNPFKPGMSLDLA